jgi:hypothetical protein
MFFIILTFFAALFIEGLGSLVSVIGISALFGANPIIIALAIALDVGKVVTVSLLYTYWSSLSKLMKTYALLAATVTMVITSAGAAGYLTGEFQKSIMGTKEGDLKVSVLKDQQTKYELRKKQIDDQIAALPTKTTVSQRLRLINGFKAEQKSLDDKIAQIDKDLPALQVKQIGTEAKAGPIVAISKAFNVPMEKAVSYVIGMIIFVFDPLAIFLIISGNFLWAKRKAEKLLGISAPVQQVYVEEPTQGTIRVPEQPTMQYPMGPQFPTNPKVGDAFFNTELGQMFFYNGEGWEQANTLAAMKESLHMEEDISFPPMRNARGSRPVDEAQDEIAKEQFFTPPVQVVEPAPEPEVVKPIISEPVVEPVYEPTGLLSNVEPEPVVVDAKEVDEGNFIPMQVPPREEITRSTLGLVNPDPSTIVDAQRSPSFREAVSTK